MLGRKLMLRMMPDVTAQPERFYSRKPLKLISEIKTLVLNRCITTLETVGGGAF